MKKTILLLSCFVFCHTLSFGQDKWQWLNPQPSGYICLKIVFTDHQTGFILNSNGDLIVTADQGNTWNIRANFPSATCMDIEDSIGVIGTYTGALYLSQDNGVSWQAIQPDTADQFQFVNVVSRDSFFVSTASGTIYATGNRGATWAVYQCGAPLQCLSWVDAMTGYAGSGNSAILKTVDGAKTWKVLSQVNYSPGNVIAIDFKNKDTGYAFRQWDSLLVTHDGGNTWQGYAPYIGYTPATMDFVNTTTGYLAGEDGSVYRSSDAGQSWTFSGVGSNLGFGRDLYSLAFLSADTGFAVGLEGQIWKTVDSGQTWASYAATYNNMSEACFPTPAVGYAVTTNNILKTIDGGKTWNALSLVAGTSYGSNTSFSYVHFSTADSGYAVTTETVTIYKTSDGGQTWTTIVPTGYSYEQATGIWYGGRDTAILCMGTALVETTDGGNTWTTIWTVANSQASGPPYILGNFFYASPVVWYATVQGQVYKTVNGGQSWASVFNNSLNYTMTGLWFLNAQQGYVADEQGYIFQTSDGGGSWQTVKQGNVNDEGSFNGIVKFFTPQVGYMTNGSNFVQAYGRIYKTFDGGESWQLSHNTGGVCINFTSDSNVVVAGYGGSILREAISGAQVDSLSVGFNHSCGTVLSANVGASMGVVDSIQFQVTTLGGTTAVIDASPNQVANGEIKVSATLNGLLMDTSYWAVVKLRFNGVTAYSDTVEFVGVGLTTPYIIDSVGVLVSSAQSGNQWFVDGKAIGGATAREYKPGKTGSYNVQAMENNCVSAMSQPVLYRANDLGVILYPNPTNGFLYLENTQYRTLQIRVLDMAGRVLMTSGNYGYGINVSALNTGEYMLEVTDANSGEHAGIMFLKL